MSPFELALGTKVKQPLDLVVPCMMGYHRDGGRNVKIMAKERKKLKARAKKLLEDAQARYEKRVKSLGGRSNLKLVTL
jgi:uncharacterized protein (DUF302 family)